MSLYGKWDSDDHFLSHNFQMDVKTKYKAKKTKIVFFDIDDTLRVKATAYMPESIKYVFKSLKEIYKISTIEYNILNIVSFFK